MNHLVEPGERRQNATLQICSNSVLKCRRQRDEAIDCGRYWSRRSIKRTRVAQRQKDHEAAWVERLGKREIDALARRRAARSEDRKEGRRQKEAPIRVDFI